MYAAAPLRTLPRRRGQGTARLADAHGVTVATGHPAAAPLAPNAFTVQTRYAMTLRPPCGGRSWVRRVDWWRPTWRPGRPDGTRGQRTVTESGFAALDVAAAQREESHQDNSGSYWRRWADIAPAATTRAGSPVRGPPRPVGRHRLVVDLAGHHLDRIPGSAPVAGRLRPTRLDINLERARQKRPA